MKRFLLVVLAVLAATPPASGNAPKIRRFALVVGANDGGPGRTRLRYAHSDAEAFARVLVQLGGVDARNAALLKQPTRDALLDGIIRMQNAIEASRDGAARTEALIYYSGHSDETGLLLGTERVSYPEIRQALNRIPADVRIAILDSCSSGALIRAKGGKHIPPFLLDESSAVRGHAILTATSADEAAQESDRIGGSFFTAALVTGLRGAADSSRDGRVTLNEAYAFAFNETLARTERSQSGPQHPNYDIQLAGSGDLVLTDLRATSAGLRLAEEVEGRVFLRDTRGQLVAELRKTAGSPVELGLEPGTYAITVETKSGLLHSELTLTQGRRMELRRSNMTPTRGEAVALRGGSPLPQSPLPSPLPPPPPPPAALPTDPLPPPPLPVPSQAARRVVPFNMTLAPGVSLANGDTNIEQRLALNVVGRAAALDGAEFALVLNNETERMHGVQFAIAANLAGGSVHGAQFASGFNFAQSGGVGQFASGANWVDGPFEGAQFAGAFNVARSRMNAAQFAGGFNLAGGESRGGQFAGGFNLLKGGLRGVQASGGFNGVYGNLTGLQAAGGFNLAGDTSGAQIAGGFNLASKVRGVQVAGGFNLASEVRTQIGSVNIARSVSGLQIGAVNIAAESDWPVGLVNIIGNGYLRFTVFTNELGLASVGLKMGGRYLYTLVSAGYAPTGTRVESILSDNGTNRSQPRWTAGGAIGVHVPVAGSLFMDVDLGATSMLRGFISHDGALLSTLRAALGFEVWRFGVYAGPTLNLLTTWRPTETLRDLAPGPRAVETVEGVRFEVFPGFVLGAQI